MVLRLSALPPLLALFDTLPVLGVHEPLKVVLVLRSQFRTRDRVCLVYADISSKSILVRRERKQHDRYKNTNVYYAQTSSQPSNAAIALRATRRLQHDCHQLSKLYFRLEANQGADHSWIRLTTHHVAQVLQDLHLTPCFRPSSDRRSAIVAVSTFVIARRTPVAAALAALGLSALTLALSE